MEYLFRRWFEITDRKSWCRKYHDRIQWEAGYRGGRSVHPTGGWRLGNSFGHSGVQEDWKDDAVCLGNLPAQPARYEWSPNGARTAVRSDHLGLRSIPGPYRHSSSHSLHSAIRLHYRLAHRGRSSAGFDRQEQRLPATRIWHGDRAWSAVLQKPRRLVCSSA